MKTTLLAATISALSIAKETGLLLNFNFGKLRIQGQSQSISISQETGAVTKGELIEVDKTIDFETVNLTKLKEAVLATVDSDLFTLKEVDLERLVCHQFKTVCTSVAFKALNTKCVSNGHVIEEERLNLTKLNNADKFINYLLPIILCEEVAVKRAASPASTDYKYVLFDMGLFDVVKNIELEVIRYSPDAGLTCWLSNKDWKTIAAQRASVTGKVGYLVNGTVQVTLNDSTRSKENEDGDEVISHRQVRFSKVIGA